MINAAGMWAPQIAAMVGTFACSIPVDHQHIALHAVEGHELSREMPCFRDTDNLVYGKAESGGVLFGGYEPNPVSRWHDGVPWEHGSTMLPADHARFQQLMAGAARRFPFLDDAGVTALVCHPGRDDARRQSAARPDARRARLLARGGPVAERLRRCRRAGPGARGARDDRCGGRRRPALPAVALRRPVSRPRLRRRRRARGLQVLLPAALPLRRLGGRPAAAPQPAARAPAGARRRLRVQERLGARRLLPSGRALAPRRRGPARVRLDEAAVPRPGRRRARRDAGARRDHRPDVVRQARGLGSRLRSPCSTASAATASIGPSGRSSTRSCSTSAAASSAT